MKYLIPTIALVYGLIFAPAAMAQETFDRFDIAVDVENEEERSAIFNFANTFALLATRTTGERRQSRLDFHSGTGLVQNGAPTIKLNGALPEALATAAAGLENVGTPCNVSRHRFADIDVLLVIHSSDNGQPQDSFRCFMVGLWIFHTGGSENLELEDWRVPYAQIISSLVEGKPAFSGFPQEEN